MVNSLYPYAALKDMPGLIATKLQYYTKDCDINDLFGFFYCYVEAPVNSYLGLLPVRDNSGINFPVGKWTGWYFSEELKFAKENGYNISVIQGYSFNRESNVFKEYVDKIYGIKSNPINKTQKSLAKSLLNNLLGRFGISLDRAITEIVNEERFEIISSMHKVTSYKTISPSNILVSYVPKLDNDIINSHDLDIIKLLPKFKDKEVQSLNVSSVAISAAITAYGRIHISKIKLDILKHKGDIFYSDTDSIVTNIKLDDSMVSPTELGKLKLEHNIDKGIFISGKTYWLSNNKGEVINKAKGIKSTSLSYFDYMNLLNDHNIDTAIKTESKTNWDLGHVTIGEKMVNINSDSYTKRLKVKVDGKWINTKPLFINTIDKSIVVYKNNFSLITYSDPKKDIAYTTDSSITDSSTKYNKVSFTKLSNTNTINYMQNTAFTYPYEMKISLYNRFYIKLLLYRDVLKLLIMLFKDYNRVSKYSNETKIRNFFKNISLYCILTLLFCTPGLLFNLEAYYDILSTTRDRHYSSDNYNYYITHGNLKNFSLKDILNFDLKDMSNKDKDFKSYKLTYLDGILSNKGIPLSKNILQIKNLLTYNIDYKSISNEDKFTRSNILNMLNNDYKFKSITFNILNDRNKSIMKEVIDKCITPKSKPYEHQRIDSIIQDRSLTIHTDKILTPINEAIFSAFTPSTYLELKKEISLVEKQLSDLKTLDLDDQIKDAHADRLQSALSYYYGQYYNHEKAVIRNARDIPLNDEDMDKVYIDLHLLKTKISNLIKDLDKKPNRRLNP